MCSLKKRRLAQWSATADQGKVTEGVPTPVVPMSAIDPEKCRLFIGTCLFKALHYCIAECRGRVLLCLRLCLCLASACIDTGVCVCFDAHLRACTRVGERVRECGCNCYVRALFVRVEKYITAACVRVGVLSVDVTSVCTR